IVFDEPTAAMDVEARRAFWSRIGGLAAQGRSVLFATHYLEEANLAADRITVIAGGRRLADGTPGEIKATLGERRLTFRVDGDDRGAAGRSTALAGVSRVEQQGHVLTLSTRDADATVRDLVGSGIGWHDLVVGEAGLEEAFLALTGAAR
ncbi:MAG: ABC transporter ATP-binding protein, partial [Solirubrobacteraceae bacterium]